MEPKRTILLCAWGNNNGHMSHCISVGRAAAAQGWRVVVATAENPLHEKLIRSEGFVCHTYAKKLIPDQLWLCWYDSEFLRASVMADRELIRATQAQVVVHDIRMSIPIAASIEGVACASVCHEPLLPGFSYPGLGVSGQWGQTQGIREINRVLAEEGEELISGDMRELLLRGAIILPSIPEFDQVPPDFPAQTHHVGPFDVPASSPTQGDGGSGSRIFFYRTVGANKSLPTFKKEFEEFGDRIYIATGSPHTALILKEQLADTNFNVAPYWDKGEIYPNAAVAVHHGGPGTALDCMATGTASIVLPGSSPERCLYGKKLEDLGVGVTVDANPSLTGDWHTAADSVDTTDWTYVGDLIRQLSQDVEVRYNCRHMRDRLVQSEHESIATVIENLKPYGSSRVNQR